MDKSTSSKFDVIVIGGGINGCGIARDLSLRGFKVLLIEKHDFAFGASGNSSGMIHGGLRYLLHDPDTTEKSSRDGGWVKDIARHLIFRIPFVYPVEANRKRSAIYLELLEAYFTAYDKYQTLKGGKKHTRLNRDDLKRVLPWINVDQYRGAVTMDEWGIDDARLTWLNAMSARENGAKILNHTEVIDFIKDAAGRIAGVKVINRLNGQISIYHSSFIVNATGAWSSNLSKLAGISVKIRPAKGIHLVYEGRITDYGVIFQALDGRNVFIMPHGTNTFIGTTDDDYFGSPDEVRVLEDEVEYLLTAARRITSIFDRIKPCGVRVGIRPTIYEYGKYEDDLTRDHKIIDHEETDGISGIYSIIGGKLASFRLVAEEISNIITKRLRKNAVCTTHITPLPGSEEEIKRESIRCPDHIFMSLYRRYGCRLKDIVALMHRNPVYRRIICAGSMVTEAEIRYVIRKEMAMTLDDVERRTGLCKKRCVGGRCSVEAMGILADELGMGWSDVERQLEAYFEHKQRLLKHVEPTLSSLIEAYRRKTL